MDIDIKQLQAIPLTDLLILGPLPAYLFFVPQNSSAHPILLKRPLDIVDAEFVNKYKTRNVTELMLYPVTNQENIKYIKDFWQRYRSENDEGKILVLREEFLEWFFKICWEGQSSGSLVDFAIAFFQELSLFEPQDIFRFYNCDVNEFKKNMLQSALHVIFSLALGYVDYKFLSDVYHVSWLFDYGFLNENFTFDLAKAKREENASLNQGYFYLSREGLSLEELDAFVAHPLKGAEMASRDFKKIFHYIETLNLIESHHGNFRYRNVFGPSVFSEFYDWELIGVLCDKMCGQLSDAGFSFKHGDASLFLRKEFQKINAQNWGDGIFAIIKRIERMGDGFVSGKYEKACL